jgi:hypothetical protein
MGSKTASDCLAREVTNQGLDHVLAESQAHPRRRKASGALAKDGARFWL